MNRSYKTILSAAFAVSIVCGCSKSPNRPADQSIRFRCDFQYGAKPNPDGVFRPKENRPDGSTAKAVNLQSVDLVRVMVIDFSAYDSWSAVTQSAWWADYNRAANSWTRNRDSWAEWKKFIGDYMSVICDQTLEIRGQEAVGTVPGVKGLNRIVIGLLKDNLIQYIGEGNGYGVEGAAQRVDIQVAPWNSTGGGQLTVSTVDIKPDSTLLFNNQTKQFKCIVQYSDGSTDTLTYDATWSSSPGTLGTINSAGLFKAGSSNDGYEKVRVSFGGKKDSAKVKLIKGSPGDMILIPAGSFTMGKNATLGTADYDPEHTVVLNAFTIDRFEVTCSQYAVFLNAEIATGSIQINAGNAIKNGHTLTKATSNYQLTYANVQFTAKTEMENQPIGQVSWWGANEYAKHFGKRLPTEAEWEKAARGTDGRQYPWGNATATGAYYNYSYYVKPIGQFHPQGDSPYGLSDMAGNIFEWVNDWYDDTYYANSPSTNPQGPATGTQKALRGGSIFYLEYYFVTCYNRARYSPDECMPDNGFRCAKNP